MPASKYNGGMSEANPTSIPAPAARWHLVLAWVALALIVAFAAWLRTQDFDESFWLDELHTAWCVAADLADVAPRAMQGNQPPLPYWLLWGWVQVAGVSEWSLRGPSLAASLASIVMAFLVVRNWTRSLAAGLAAAFFLAIEPESIRYGGEARVYAWLQLLALAHVWLTARVLQTGALRTRVGWIIVALLLAHTHYLAALLVAAEGMVLVLVSLVAWMRRLPRPYTLPRLACDLALAALGYAPLVPGLLDVAARSENWKLFIPPTQIADLWEIVPFQRVLVDVTLFTIVAIVVRRVGGWKPVVAKLNWRPALTLSGVFALAWTAAWLLSLSDATRIFYPRYLLLLYVLPALWLGWIVSLGATPALRVAALSVAGVLLWISSPVHQDYFLEPQARPRRNEDWRSVANLFNQIAPRGRAHVILLAPGLIECEGLREGDDAELREYCSYPLRSAYPLTRPSVIHPLSAIDPGNLSPDEVAFVNRHAQVWVVVRGPPGYRLRFRNQLAESFDTQRVITVHERSAGQVEILKIVLPPSQRIENAKPERKAAADAELARELKEQRN
jgi:hypothetical protein